VIEPVFSTIVSCSLEKFQTAVPGLFQPLFKIAQAFPEAFVRSAFGSSAFLIVLQTMEDVTSALPVLLAVVPAHSAIHSHCLSLCRSLGAFSPGLAGVIELVWNDLNVPEIVKVCEAVVRWVLESDSEALERLIEFLVVKLGEEATIPLVSVDPDLIVAAIERVRARMGRGILELVAAFARSPDFPADILPRLRARLA
jgi:hypothetical protein